MARFTPGRGRVRIMSRNPTGRVAKCITTSRRGGLIDYREYDLSMASDGRSERSAKVAKEKRNAMEKALETYYFQPVIT